jgi:RNA polymerase sigma-70 factor (ECF subfamily)
MGVLDNTANTDPLAELISRAKRLDPAAFDDLVDRYSSRLYSFLYRFTGRPHDAEDLVQEVFVRVVRMIEHYRHDGRFEAWLFRIARNLARDRARQVGRTPDTSPLGGVHEELLAAGGPRQTPGPSPPEALEAAEGVDRLQEGLARLNAEEREVIMLRHYSNMSFSEVAELLGTPLGTALARAHRGLAKLRRWMESSP